MCHSQGESPFAHTTCLWSAVSVFIWLTDGWCTSHSSLYTYWRCQTWNQYIMKSSILYVWEAQYLGWIQMLPYCADVKLLQVCLPETIIVPAILHLLDRTTLHHLHFVKFKHHVHWDHKQTKIGFMSNTQCFDKWLYPVVDLGRDGRQRFHGVEWGYVVENRCPGLAIRTKVNRVYKCDMHSIQSAGLCLYPEVTGINSCNITEMQLHQLYGMIVVTVKADMHMQDSTCYSHGTTYILPTEMSWRSLQRK